MITIKPIELKDFAILMQLEVTDEQAPFAVSFEKSYQARHQSEVIFSISTKKDKEIIGFLILDKKYYYTATFAKSHDLGLTYMMLGKQYQRQGIGRKVIDKLKMYAYTIDPNSQALCTSVPHQNQGALDFLKATGFADTAQSYLGEHGKEIIFRQLLA